MKSLQPTRRDALAFLALAGLARAAGAAVPPGDSIYQLHPSLVDQDGRPFDLASLQGRVVLASMFYSSCQMVCPVIFETMRQTVAALSPQRREQVRVLMVTFDPQRDTVDVLKQTALAHGCDAHWRLVRGSETEARRIAALLGVQYRRLPSGEFNHSSAIVLVAQDGRIVTRTGVMGEVDPAFVAAIQAR